jgi:membrane protease subunit HflC
MRALLLVLLLLVGLGLGSSLLGYGPVIITREGEMKIALFLGDANAVIKEPGLGFGFGTVRTFDARWQWLTSEAREIQTLDQERIVIDNYVVWKIAEPLAFYKSFPAGRLEAETQINQQVRGKVREVIGQRTLADVLYEARTEIMAEITRLSGEGVSRFGIAIDDVRINRTELPRGAEENVYARMRAERNRLARKYRAEGEEEARRIRAEADREARVLVAEARGEAERERGTGDAESARIYAEAYSSDPDFYEFLRSLEAYEKTIGEGTTLVLPPDHEFFRLLQTGGDDPGRPMSPSVAEEGPASPPVASEGPAAP